MASLGHVGTGLAAIYHFRASAIMKVSIFVVLLVKVCGSVSDDASDHDHDEKRLYFDQLYAEGVKAYNDQLWYKCAHSMENAATDYRHFKKTLTDCRMACKKEKNESNSKLKSLSSDFLGDFSTFGIHLKQADCFRRCKTSSFQHRPGFKLNKMLEAVFESRKLYQYLQFCWYKLDRLKLAASASYTYFLANPDDADVKVNIAFYRDKARVRENDFIDLELKPYKEHYIRAMMAYGEEDWLGVVDHMEKGIEQYFVEEERCRTDCQDKFDSDEDTTTSHFSGLIADHVVRVLDCQLGCEGNLSVVYSEPIKDFLAEQFHYLQFTYYKLEKIQEAVEVTASYLLFHPDDDVVSENKKIFKKKYQYSEDQFIPRNDTMSYKEFQKCTSLLVTDTWGGRNVMYSENAVRKGRERNVKVYLEQRQKLRSLLDFLQENLMPEVEDEISVSDEDTLSEELSSHASDQPTTDHHLWMERYERLGLHVIAKEKDLQRPYRFAADGLLKQDQCDDILHLMEDIKVDTKGVQTFTLEHGRRTVVAADENYEASLRLFMRATEVMRHYTQRYYNISGSLYFKNTSIVCWSKVEEPEVENDCIPQEFGTCDPESKVKGSELVEDQFVTVTYLSTLDDGDVYFLGENITVDTSLGLKTGRTIGFQTGDRHGLHIPASGRRCGLVIAYSTQRSPDEEDYVSTLTLLQTIEHVRMQQGMQDSATVMKDFKNMGVRVEKNSSALAGGERFVADGLSTDAECVSLKNMVMELGKAGDGYGGQISPHTQNELFAGLNLKQLSQSGALVGDGYDHLEAKPSYISPHTQHETFQGLTIYRAAKLMHMGLVNTFAMRAFLDLSEKSRLFVEKYFNLTQPLYFDFTHLVCRSAVEDSIERDDLSHPVHADNCVLQPNGSCLKEYPAFIQRDYSAILYLNDDFQGGEFFFAHSNKSEQTSLRPKCGRLVGFNAKEYHGVKAVQSGVRCALALWFTHNPNFKELAHIHAKKVLKTIMEEREAEELRAEKSSGKEEAAKDSEKDAADQEDTTQQGTETSKGETVNWQGDDGDKYVDVEEEGVSRTDSNGEGKEEL